MLLTKTEFDSIKIDNISYTIDPSTFVKKPHFTSKKVVNSSVFADLADFVKSQSFENFAQMVLASESFDKTKVLSCVSDSDFCKKPPLPLTKSIRIDVASFLQGTGTDNFFQKVFFSSS